MPATIALSNYPGPVRPSVRPPVPPALVPYLQTYLARVPLDIITLLQPVGNWGGVKCLGSGSNDRVNWEYDILGPDQLARRQIFFSFYIRVFMSQCYCFQIPISMIKLSVTC